MRLISLDFQCGCQECKHEWDETIYRNDLELGLFPPCPVCGGEKTLRVYRKSVIMQAALPDGTKRGGGFQEYKEAARLEVVKAGMAHGDRAGIQKEIDRLKASKS